MVAPLRGKRKERSRRAPAQQETSSRALGRRVPCAVCVGGRARVRVGLLCGCVCVGVGCVVCPFLLNLCFHSKDCLSKDVLCATVDRCN